MTYIRGDLAAGRPVAGCVEGQKPTTRKTLVVATVYKAGEDFNAARSGVAANWNVTCS